MPKRLVKVEVGGEMRSLMFDNGSVTVGDVIDRLGRDHCILVNGESADVDQVLEVGDQVEAHPPAKTGA